MNPLRTAVVLLFLFSALTGCRSPASIFFEAGLGAVANSIGEALSTPVISIHYSHSRRRQNRDIVITVLRSQKMTITTTDAHRSSVSSEHMVPDQDFHALLREIQSVDWEKVARDQVRGVDGTSVHITAAPATPPGGVSVWSPDYDFRKRGLRQLCDLIERSFDIAGLDAEGLPQHEVSSIPHPVPGSATFGSSPPAKTLITAL